MPTMDGLMTWYISHDELEKHLFARIAHHAKRNEELLGDAANINEKLEDQLGACVSVTERMSLKASSNYGGNISQRDQLLTRARAHATKAATLQFFLDHIPADGGFEITSAELAQLEFIPSPY